jgi:hypothetical protein
VHWSFFSTSLPPLIEVSSGDFVTIETVTHHANDDRDRTVVGDRGSPARDAAEYVLHGFSYPSYLAELGSKAQSDFYGNISHLGGCRFRDHPGRRRQLGRAGWDRQEPVRRGRLNRLRCQ